MALLLVFGLLIKLPLFLYPKAPLVSAADGKLYVAIAGFFNSGNALWTSVFSFALLYIQALILTNLVNEYRMTVRPGFLPALSFLLLTSLLPEWNYLSAPLLGSVCLLWALYNLFALYNVAAANGKIFNIGLLLGLSSFIYLPSLVLVLCFFIGLMILRPFRLNELFLFLLGLVAPYYFFGAWLYLTDQFTLTTWLPTRFSIHLPATKPSLWLIAGTVLLGLPFLTGGYYVQVQLRKMLIQARKNWSILLFFLVLAMIVPSINGTDLFTGWIISLLPFACFHAATYLYAGKKWTGSLLFFLTLAFIITQQYVSNNWH